jgi:hypothetical protein
MNTDRRTTERTTDERRTRALAPRRLTAARVLMMGAAVETLARLACESLGTDPDGAPTYVERLLARLELPV